MRPTTRTPRLERLEDRTVPTTLVDLTTAGAQGTVGGVIFQQANPQPTGCGVIHDFVRLFSKGNASTEQGYNTDARPLQFDENNSPVFTRSLQLGQVPVVVVGGVAYREFLLGVNQKHSSPLVSLDELRIYVGNAPNLIGYDATTQKLAGLTPVYDLGALGTTTVMLNAALSHGNGSGDAFVLVPDALLTAAGGNFIYLYSKFGLTASTNGGFEQWAVQSQSTQLSSLSGYVYNDANGNRVFDTGDSGIADVLVTLTGVDSQGNAVNVSAWTNASGFYIFSGLNAGTYTLTETTPAGFTADAANVGSLGGTAPDFNDLASILVPAGSIGRNYDFGNVTSSSSLS
jgi:hypothetical protein